MKDKNGILKYMVISLCLGVFLGWFIFGFLNVTGNATKYDNSKNAIEQGLLTGTGCGGLDCGGDNYVCRYYNGECDYCWCQSEVPKDIEPVS